MVWDPLVRILHWSLVFCFVLAWQSPTRSDLVHEWSGYACVAIAVARIAWGIRGSRWARFDSFVRSPRTAWDYLRDLMSGRSHRHLGHNPLGGYMILAMLGVLLVVCATGWMFTTDRWWGIEWVRTTHDVGTDVLLVLVALHILGNIVMSWVHRENLIAAMWHGRKRDLP